MWQRTRCRSNAVGGPSRASRDQFADGDAILQRRVNQSATDTHSTETKALQPIYPYRAGVPNLAFRGIPQMRWVVGLSPPPQSQLQQNVASLSVGCSRADMRGPLRGWVKLNCRLLGLGLGKRGTEHASLVVFEAPDLGLHVL